MSGQAYKDTIFYCDNAKLHVLYNFPIFPNFKAVLEADQNGAEVHMRLKSATHMCLADETCSLD